jgi:ATP-dependent Clp protease ATP-binding subunit ClpC
VLVLAQEEARLLHHSFIGTEHILLGLIHEGDGLAAQALESLGITLEAVRTNVAEAVGVSGSAPSGSPPFTPRAKKVLELSLREAMQLEHGGIGTEHLLLGLVREGEGVAVQVLVSLGVVPGQIRQEVLTLISSGGEPRVGETASSAERSGQAISEPLCPRCRASVTDSARFRTIDLEVDDGAVGGMPVSVVYCGRCGTMLQMFQAGGNRPTP